MTGGEYDYFRVLIAPERENLYRRIDERVDLMVREGLVEELRAVLARGYPRDLVSLDTVGYKEWYPYLDGEAPFEACLDAVKRDTRRYAKRQVTWFRHHAGYRAADGADERSLEREQEEIENWLSGNMENS